MAQNSNDILSRLQTVRGMMRLRRCVYAAVLALSVLGGLLALLGLFDCWVPLREPAAAGLVGAVCAIGAGILGAALVRTLFRQPTSGELARRIEQAHPELMNTLVCAVEQLARPTDERGVFGNAVIEQARERTRLIDFVAPVMPARLRTSRLGIAALVCAALLVAGINSRPTRKAVAWSAGAPAVVVDPGTAEVPRHADMKVEAQVRRWEDTAEIEFEDAGGSHTFAMNAENGSHTFTFYDMTAPIRYRVLSPSAASEWHELSVYTPPDYDSISIEFSPPEYTGLSPHTRDAWGDASAVEGSRVEVILELPEGISAQWRTEDEAVAFSAAEPGQARHRFELEQTVSARLVLRDGEGHVKETSSARFEVIADQPPTVDVLAPRDDTFVAPDDEAELAALAADDYGLAEVSLHLSASGRRLEARRLFAAERDDGDGAAVSAPAEKEVNSALAPEELGLEAGDVLTGYFVARDNRRPQGQSTRSRVFFIEIRPESEQDDQQQQDGEGEKQEVDIGRLIAESKRLIRLSYDVGAQWRTPKPDELEDLQRGLADLRNEIMRMSDEVREAARKQGMSGDIPHLNEAAEALQAAEESVEDRLVSESIPPQEQALTWLVRLAQELRKNQAESAGSGEPQEGEPSQSEEEDQTGEGESSQSLADRLQQLRDFQSRIADLAQRQSALNEELEAARRLDLSPAERRELSGRQQELGGETANLQQAMQQAQLRDPARSTQSAAQSMNSGAANVGQGAMGAGARDGARAHSGLLAAEEGLRDSMRRLAGAQVNALTDQARTLAESEQAAADASREFAQSEPDAQQVDEAREQQQDLRRQTEQLLDAVQRTAGDLQQTFPSAAETLGKAARQARDDRLTREMERAENALLYERFDTAAKGQQKAAGQLQRLGDSLQEGAGKLPTIGQRELQEALQKIRAGQKRMQQAAETAGKDGEQAAQKQVEQTRGQMGQLLQRLGQELGEPGLGNLGMLMEQTDKQTPPGEQAAYTAELLQRAGRMLERHVVRDNVRRAYRISRRAADVPEEYREAVDEYFRRLSEEE